MKRFHVHVHVEDLDKSIGFYSKLFAAEPTRVEGDYAKWMLDDPRINFAISTRGAKPGIDHLGFQTDDAEELAALKARAEAADMALLDEGETTCCYARSEKHWVTDPQGIAWEHFHTLGRHPRLQRSGEADAASACCTPAAAHGATAAAADASACCTPTPRGKPIGIAVKAVELLLLSAAWTARRTSNVLILCTHNSARSVLAEGMLEPLAARLGKDVQAHSAGSAPSGRINPFAIEALRNAGIDTGGYRSKSWDEFSRDRRAAAVHRHHGLRQRRRRDLPGVLRRHGRPAGQGALGLPRSRRTPKAATTASAAPSS